ncbi:hypothetical protein C5B42_01035 [Candidatus Cerribacteria bacterium 'Amazon FNV 2010 28 9']|uniref:Cell shape-determining protein MreB n=1 Tax=Candidatus Cerribacteria bacterium 'Amazon FNV 2010 28 9' TaxID=2081795 RepID=A0A317JQ01_9BACT|nr:MAG: hypothetical protein C5B42_01035 [Candidatus Cerribacteria bacterium 'Amazon FNV 2010 28 9']
MKMYPRIGSLSCDTIKDMLSATLALDPGSATTRLFTKTTNQQFDLPSVLTVPQGKQREEVVGTQTFSQVPVFPNSRVTDPRIAASFIRDVFHQATKQMTPFFPPQVLVSIGSTQTHVEQKALLSIIKSLTGGEVRGVADLFAAAVGLGVDTTASKTSVIVSLGQGTSSIGSIGSGALLSVQELECTGSSFIEALQKEIRSQYHLECVASEIEKILTRYGQQAQIAVQGKGPKGFAEYTIAMDMCEGVLSQAIQELVISIQRFLSGLPASSASCVLEEGLLLVGGVSQLEGLSSKLSKELCIPVSVAPDPMYAVMSGLKKILSYSIFEEIGSEQAGQMILGL